MIYESATGGVPFTGPSLSIMSQHYSAVPESPRARNPDISPELEHLILALMAKRPEDRPSTGAIISQLLREEIDLRVGTDHTSTLVELSRVKTGDLTGTSDIRLSVPPKRDGTAAARSVRRNRWWTGRVRLDPELGNARDGTRSIQDRGELITIGTGSDNLGQCWGDTIASKRYF